MSLVNQMLKDLEKRSFPETSKSEMALAGIQYAASSRHDFSEPDITLSCMQSLTTDKNKKRKSYSNLFYKLSIAACVLMFIALVCAVGKLVYERYYHVQKPMFKRVMAPANNVLPLNSATQSSQQVMPTILTGITLQIQQDTTFLRLLLNKSALFRVDHDDKHEKLIIFLEHSKLVASLPPINYANSAIKNMEMFNLENGDLKIVLTLNPGAEIRHLEINEAGKYPELQLDMSYSDPYGAESGLTKKNAVSV